MSGSHLDQTYLGADAATALVGTASAPATTPGAVDPAVLVPAPLPPQSNTIVLGLAAGIAAYCLCRALQTKGKKIY